MSKFKKIIYTSLVSGMLLGIAGCANSNATTSSSSSTTVSPSSTTKTVATSLKTTEDSVNNSDETIDWDALPTQDVTLSNEALTITEAGTYVLSGSTTAGVNVNTEGNVRLVLNGVTIKSSNSAAIYIENAGNTVIKLAAGSENTVEDSAKHTDETIDGAIYSSDDLIFNGEGQLTVVSNFKDAIVSKDDLTFTSGTYVVKSADDGIRGKDSVSISAGTFTIDAVQDGIKATNDTDAEKGLISISGGDFTIRSGDDGIHAEEKIVIDGGKINIETSVEGIEAALITINDGDISLYATDDGINATVSNFTSPVLTINGGAITIKMAQGDTDAIDSNGDLYVNGGTIDVTADSSFDYDGTAKYTAGTIIINGEQVDTIPANQMMGGGPGGMR